MPAVRPYRRRQDLADMRALLMEGRAREGNGDYPHVGLLAWSVFLVDRHLGLRRHLRLWHDGPRLVAYALLGEDPAFDWQILPGCEGWGIDEEALAWAQGLAAELRAEDPARWSGPLIATSRDDDAARLGFLARHGFDYRGESAEVDLVRPLEEAFRPGPLPSGWRVRGLHAGEVPARAAAHRAVWQQWAEGDVAAADYAALVRMPGYRRSLDIVAVGPGGDIGAYANCWLDPVNRVGDFGPVGAVPTWRRRGLTRAVLREGLRRLRAAGMKQAIVSTGVGNTAARSLYESVGFVPIGHHLDFVKPA